MNEGNKKEGLEYKRPRRLKCVRRGSRRPHKYKNKNMNLLPPYKGIINAGDGGIMFLQHIGKILRDLTASYHGTRQLE
jgi:hypothetical protein